MRGKQLVPILLCGLVVLGVTVGSVSAVTQQNLVVTAGASGQWVTGGYDFQGTAYAYRSGFKPFHTLTKFTVIIWTTYDSLSTVQFFLSERAGSNAQVRLYVDTTNHLKGQWGDGATVQTYGIGTGTGIGVGKLQMLTMAWNKDVNLGKLDLWVNGTKYTSSLGITNAISANVDCIFGASEVLANNYLGTIYAIRLFTSKLSDGKIAEYYAAGENYVDFPVWHYYNLNTGSGTTFYDYTPSWQEAQEIGADFRTPSWETAQQIEIPFFVEAFTGFINFFLVLGGLCLLPTSTFYLVYGGRSALTEKKLYAFAFLLIMGLSLFIGGILL